MSPLRAARATASQPGVAPVAIALGAPRADGLARGMLSVVPSLPSRDAPGASSPDGEARGPSRLPDRFRIAHLSDVHLLERDVARRGTFQRLRMRFVSMGRELDEAERARNLTRALEAAKSAGARHVVISGDLTELGTPAQFERVAELLHGSSFAPHEITLVPGNHDVYDTHDGWSRALEGPLAAFASGSAGGRGAHVGGSCTVVERDDVCFLPLDVTRHQAITRSSGELSAQLAAALEARLGDPGVARKPIVVVAHHPPQALSNKLVQWLDGLQGGARLMSMLSRFPNVHVLHGHLHRVVDRLFGPTRSSIFGAPAVVEASASVPGPVRLYDVVSGALLAAGLVG